MSRLTDLLNYNPLDPFFKKIISDKKRSLEETPTIPGTPVSSFTGDTIVSPNAVSEAPIPTPPPAPITPAGGATPSFIPPTPSAVPPTGGFAPPGEGQEFTGAEETPIDKFNLALMEMLKRAQAGYDPEELFKRESALKRAAIGKASEITPEEQRVLSPQQQASIRSGDVRALEPEIDAISAKIKSSDVRMQNFEALLDSAREFGEEFSKNLTPSKEIVDGYRSMIRAGGNPTSIPGEIRNKVMSQLTPEDWSSWGTETRKGAPAGDGGLTTYQRIATFNRIADKFGTSPLVAANDRASILRGTTTDLAGDTNNSAKQVAFIYSLIQALDTYQSAVREGEISLIQETQGVRDKIINLPDKISKGSIMSPDVVNRYVGVAQTLASNIQTAASAKQSQFASQAKTAGVGTEWNNFISGFQSPAAGVPSAGGEFSVEAPDGNIYTFPDEQSLNAFKAEAQIQ